MVVELISVGTEILLGNIVNTNARFLAEQCAALGLFCYNQVTVGDNQERLEEAFRTAFSRSDIVIVTGGLGPTDDDLTKETAAAVVGRSLVEDQHSRERLETYFKGIQKTITANNWKQTLVPEEAIVIDNHNGTAPGLIIQEGDKHIILLPGPPNELYPMFKGAIIPYLSGLNDQILYSKTVKIVGLGESYVETAIKDLIDEQSNPTIAPYAKTGEVHLRITASAKSEDEGEALIKPYIRELYQRFGQHIFTEEESISLEEAIVTELLERELTLATAESCTGGLLSGRFINVSGISAVYKEGFVTYSNDAKEQTLNVNKETLETYGAVSHETAKEMAKGAARTAKANCAISTTGIAGPDGGTAEKPVGLVYVGVCIDGQVKSKEFNFNGNRAKIRDYSVVRAMEFFRECLLSN